MLNNDTTTAVVNAVRYAVKTRGAWAKFVAENNVTRDDIAETARALASLAYPNDEPVQKVDGKRTRFGNAVQAAGNGMRAAIAATEEDNSDEETEPKTPDYLGLAVEAARRAHDKGEVSTDALVDAIRAALTPVETVAA